MNGIIVLIIRVCLFFIAECGYSDLALRLYSCCGHYFGQLQRQIEVSVVCKPLCEYVCADLI